MNSPLLQHINENIEAIEEDLTPAESLELEQYITEVLNATDATNHSNTSRGSLMGRRYLRDFAFTALLGPLGGLYVLLSEGGFIQTSEKKTFIRFQGLVTMHIGRLDKRLGSKKPSTMLASIRKTFDDGVTQLIKQNKKHPDVKKLGKGYADMLSSEFALVTAGYLALMKKNKANPKAIELIQGDIMKIGQSGLKGSGIWNRIKSGWISPFALTAFRPAMTFAKFFETLNSKNPALGLVQTAQSKLAKMKI